MGNGYRSKRVPSKYKQVKADLAKFAKEHPPPAPTTGDWAYNPNPLAYNPKPVEWFDFKLTKEMKFDSLAKVHNLFVEGIVESISKPLPSGPTEKSIPKGKGSTAKVK